MDDSHHNPNRFTVRFRGPLWIWLAALSCCVAMGLWAGCSGQQRYKWLSVFFDGVPDPNAPITDQAGGRTSRRRANVKYYKHQPFAEGNCQACHGSFASKSVNTLTPDASVCLKCHEQVTQEYPVMHGPVAVGACLVCHNPHESPQTHLLREPEPQLCVQCHDRQMVLGSEPPAHQDTSRGCLECHFGHGAVARYMLRAQQSPEPLPDQSPPAQPQQDSGPNERREAGT